MATIIDYCPLNHAQAVQGLWQRNLGATWPLSQRIFLSRTCGRCTYEPGDAVVAVESGGVAGFAMMEVTRSSTGVEANASIMAVVVDGPHQGRGLGMAMLSVLEKRAKTLGCTSMTFGGSFHRFWTGLPADMPALEALLMKAGYAIARDQSVVDLVFELGRYEMSPQYKAAAAAVGVSIGPCRDDELAAVLDFEMREFPNWVPNLLAMYGAGDSGNVIVVRHDREIVGTVNAFTPASRFRSANQVWEGIHGQKMGGYGAVGIAKAWRGKGLGAAMCQAAALHVQRCGANCCYIDWTGIGAFYEKLGARVCARFYHATKPL